MKVVQNLSPVPSKLLTCSLCDLVFNRPITLSCGHTFCRDCIRHKGSTHASMKNGDNVQKTIRIKNKLNICSICDCIIWRGEPDMRENLTIQNLVAKYYPDEVSKRRKLSQDYQRNYNKIDENSRKSNFYNKILIKLKQPHYTPMPSCHFETEFMTAFIDDVINQSDGLVLTWDTIFAKNLGLLSKMKKVEPINVHSAFSRIVFDTKHSNQVLELKYKGYFLGLQFVNLEEVENIQINLRHKLIILGEDNSNKIVKTLQLCNCSIFHSTNQQKIQAQNFNIFFSIYDNMNNPHYLRQILTQISDQPFQNRVQNKNTIYCILRLLKMPNEQRRSIVMCFDDVQRIQRINGWLLSNRNKMIDEILNVKIPGKYNTGYVFFIIFILLAFNLFQDYRGQDGR